MSNKELVEKFLQKLTDLSNEYGIVIEGCGCCESPYLAKADVIVRGYRCDSDIEGYETVVGDQIHANIIGHKIEPIVHNKPIPLAGE